MEKEILKGLGLNEREAQLYLSLIKERSSTASKLAKLAKVNRTTAYLELENLMKKGLVSYIIKNSKRYYRAASPIKFIEILDEKKKKFQNILPILRNLHSPAEQFNIEVYEGKEGIKTFYSDIYKNCKEFFVLGATGKAVEVLKYSYPHFLTKFMKKNIKEKALANLSSKKIMGKHPKTHFKIKYLPKNHEAKITTIIYSNKVAFQSLQDENIYVVIIKDKLMNQTYKSHFDLIWDLLD